jgi:hypothetical protein
MPRNGFYFDTIIRQEPIDEAKLNPDDNLEEFGPITPQDLDYFASEARRAEATGRAVMATFGGTAFGDIALVPGPMLKHPKGIRAVEYEYLVVGAVIHNKEVATIEILKQDALFLIPLWNIYFNYITLLNYGYWTTFYSFRRDVPNAQASRASREATVRHQGYRFIEIALGNPDGNHKHFPHSGTPFWAFVSDDNDLTFLDLSIQNNLDGLFL